MFSRTLPTRARLRTLSAAAITVLTAGLMTAATTSGASASVAVRGAAGPAGTTPTAYVANITGRSVSEINTGTAAVTGTVPTDLAHGIGLGPTFETASPDGKAVWVTDAGNDGLTVIDTATHQAVDTIHVCVGESGNSPAIFTPDGSKVYVSCGFALFEINTATHKPTQLAAAAEPLNLVMSSDGTKLYVTTESGDLVTLDTATDTAASSLSLSGIENAGNDGMVESKDGARLYVSVNAGIAVVNTAADALVTTIPITNGAGELALTADDSELLATSATAQNLLVVSTATDAVTATVPFNGEFANDLTTSPTDSSTAYVQVRYTASRRNYPYRILAINLATDTATVAVALETPSTFIDFSPDGKTVYASARHTDILQVINALTGTVTKRLHLELWQGDIAFADQGRQAYVTTGANLTERRPGEVWVLDTSTYTKIATILPVNQRPADVVAAPDGATVYVEGRDAILALKTANNTNTVIPFPDGTDSLAISHDGTKLYVGDDKNGRIYVLSTATDKITTFFAVPFSATAPAPGPGQFRAMAVSADDTKLYVTDASDVSVIDTATNTISATYNLAGNAAHIAVSPNGALVYASLANNPVPGGAVAIISTATGTVSRVDAGSNPSGLAFTPDGSEAYVANDGNNDSVSVISAATGTVTGTITVGFTPSAVAFTPDGTEAYITNEASNSVSVINTATNTVANTITVGANPIAVTIAP